MNLNKKNIVVFDCEIVNDVDGKTVTWDRKDLMGLSVACLFDYLTGDWNVYFAEDVQRLADRLNSADLVVGFNTEGFDIPLIVASGGKIDPVNIRAKSYDLLIESRKAMGWTPAQRYPSGMKLDDHLSETFGHEFMKTEDGALAPKMWRDGRRGEVTSYCLADVRREKALFEHVVSQGWAATRAHGKRHFDLSKVQAIADE